LLNDLAVVAKDQTGKFKFNPAPFDLEKFCMELTRDRALFFNPTVVIEMAYQLEETRVALDKELVRYILLNLLSNANKFSSPGSTVNFTVSKAAFNYIEFRIQDRGIGIPENDLTTVYEPFHRGENVSEYPGSGLGLSIVKRCVEIHLGSITIDSKAGTGTTVAVKLPYSIVQTERP